MTKVQTQLGNSPLASLWKSSGYIFMIYASENEAACCWDAFLKFSPYEVYEKSSVHIFTIYASRDVAVCRKFRCILEVLRLQELQKKFLVQFHDLCVQKRSCFLWSADAFRKFSPYEVYEKSSGCIFTIYASKNKAVFKFRRISEVFCLHVLQKMF